MGTTTHAECSCVSGRNVFLVIIYVCYSTSVTRTVRLYRDNPWSPVRRYETSWRVSRVAPSPFRRKLLSTTTSPMPRGLKTTLSASKEALYQQRKSPVQRELSNATRLFARQMCRATSGKEPTLQCAGQRATHPPRRWCLVASLFGGECCHPMYALGALKLAESLPTPWSLWLAIDTATLEQFGDMLRSAPNIHIVRIVQPPEPTHEGAGAPERARGKRPRTSGAKWPVNTFTRYVLLDDAELAGAVVVDLDVHGDAATKAIKLWRAADAAADDDHENAFGVVSYPVGATRGMQG